MAVNGSKTTENGDSILISLQEPYLNTVEIISYSDETLGESEDSFYIKSFRWGIDGVTYSDWIQLSSESLSKLVLNPKNPFWIQYRYEHVGYDELEFVSISLEVVTDDGIICKVPQIQCCDSSQLSGSTNLVVDCCGTAWNPYDLSRASQMYNQLSSITSNLFGFCVTYFKTAADQRSKDVILKEYSLYNVISTAEVKILIPDNELPTREIQFNPLMIDFPVQFEVHIVKSAFQQVFGLNSKPQVKDYLYFEQYMNKIYEVDSVAEADDFLYSGSYWRVSLVPYQQRTAVQYPDKNIEDIKDSLVLSVEEKFKEEREDEFQDVRKPNQYNTIGTLANDYVRRVLDKKLLIKEENIYSKWTIISKYNYQLHSMNRFEDSVEYRYNNGWSESSDRSFTFWIRPRYYNKSTLNTLIISLEEFSGNLKINLTQLLTGSDKIAVGDWVNVLGTNSYNGIVEVLFVGEDYLVVNTPFVDDIIYGNAKINKEYSNTFFVYENKNNKERPVSFVQTPNWFIVKINETLYKFNLKDKGIELVNDMWYSLVINLNSLSKQLSLFIYENVNDNNKALNSAIKRIFIETLDYSPTTVVDGYAWSLLGCSLDITNIRIWKKPIEEEQQSLVVSQYVVKDTHLTLLLDNASPSLLLNKISNPR